MTYGNDVGDVCGRCGCIGIIEAYPNERCYCPICGWIERVNREIGGFFDD